MARSAPLTALLATTALLLLLVLAVARRSEAVNCTVTELAPCLPALIIAPAPIPECCTKLKEQEPCLCGYLKDPTLGQYFRNPNAKVVADACGVPYPPKC